ncbi:PREDICTED: 15 kDa protein B-like [Chrysochloris asiatica]|uniref:15 kDa protein B-like n=1 Tax=Chrysochloris asiatica TaxID=185453 RepID=A0A9B0TW97_CHRAS|nr:PREDICTED: 15 kDa protein B-like [Chrysochloris asiatica]
MAGVWRALMLMVALTIMSCEAYRRLSYESVVTQALQFFNQGRIGEPVFRLLEAIPPPRSVTIPLNFRIKETVCLSTQQRPQQECAFREGGEERNCTGNFLMVRHFRILAVDCSRDRGRQQEGLRNRRSAESSQDTPPEAKSTKLPPVVRNLYERAKYDIIANILRNF